MKAYELGHVLGLGYDATDDVMSWSRCCPSACSGFLAQKKSTQISCLVRTTTCCREDCLDRFLDRGRLLSGDTSGRREDVPYPPIIGFTIMLAITQPENI